MASVNLTRIPTLADAAFPDMGSRTRAILLVVSGALFVAVAAQASFTPPSWFASAFASVGVPIEGTPVPVTLQTLAVGVTGAALGSRFGIASLLLYMMAGIVGLPVYAGAMGDVISGEVAFGATGGSLWGGAAFWAIPSGGYIVGFVLAAFAIGRLAERGWDRSPLRLALALFVGSILIYAIGLPWLYASFDDMTLARTLDWGLWPFIPGDTLKLVISAGMLPGVWALIGRRSPTAHE